MKEKAIRFNNDWKGRRSYEELKKQGNLGALPNYDLKDPFGKRWENHPGVAKPRKQ